MQPYDILLSYVHQLLTVLMVINSGTDNSKRSLYAAVTLNFVLYDRGWLTTYCSVKTFGMQFQRQYQEHGIG